MKTPKTTIRKIKAWVAICIYPSAITDINLTREGLWQELRRRGYTDFGIEEMFHIVEGDFIPKVASKKKRKHG
jgi:hypothetical protein